MLAVRTAIGFSFKLDVLAMTGPCVEFAVAIAVVWILKFDVLVGSWWGVEGLFFRDPSIYVR
jgi:hypothetical protein